MHVLVTDAAAWGVFWGAIGMGWLILIGSVVRQYLKDKCWDERNDASE